MPLEPPLPRLARAERVGQREAEQLLRGGLGGGGAEEGDADGLVPGRLREVAEGELQAGEVEVGWMVGLEGEEGAL
jgi:hypothetical protein